MCCCDLSFERGVRRLLIYDRELGQSRGSLLSRFRFCPVRLRRGATKYKERGSKCSETTHHGEGGVSAAVRETHNR